MSIVSSMRRTFSACIVAAAATACTAPPPAPAPPAPPPVAEEVKQVAELVDYYTRVAALGPEDQRREYASASQALTRDPSVYNRIRVGLLASMPGTPFQDDVRALSLLEPYARAGPSYDRLRQFGAMWHQSLAERTKARARADQLTEQLDALRAVERTIIERGQPAPAVPKR